MQKYLFIHGVFMEMINSGSKERWHGEEIFRFIWDLHTIHVSWRFIMHACAYTQFWEVQQWRNTPALFNSTYTEVSYCVDLLFPNKVLTNILRNSSTGAVYFINW